MVLHASEGRWQHSATKMPMWPQSPLRPPRMRSRKQSAQKRRRRLLKRCLDRSHETAKTLAGTTHQDIHQEEGASKGHTKVQTGRALNGLSLQAEGSKRQVADASRQGGDVTQRAPDELRLAVVVGHQPARFLQLWRNRHRNLDCASVISGTNVTARQEHRTASANTSTSIRLDSNRCPSRTRCLLQALPHLAKREIHPRSHAETEMIVIITKREDANSGMDPRPHRCAFLEQL